MKIRYILFFLLAVTLVIGCAKPPTAEMNSARDAVFRAENDADAVRYATGTLARAQDALRRMQSEAESKRYDTAKTHAAEAVAAAERAITEGRAAATRAGSDSASLITGLRPEIEETARNVAGARYAELDLDYAALDRGIVNAHNKTDQAEADQAEGRYQDALDKARVVRADLFEINQRVAGAVTRKK